FRRGKVSSSSAIAIASSPCRVFALRDSFCPVLLSVRGKKIEAQHIGRSGGPTLVFLHEGLGSLGLWRDFPQRVAQATGLPALVYSRAGYGQSDRASMPRPIRYLHYEAQLLPAGIVTARSAPPLTHGD